MTATAQRERKAAPKVTAPPPRSKPTIQLSAEGPPYFGLDLEDHEKIAVKKGHMIIMVSMRKQRVASTNGHVKNFEAREITLVPRALVQEAMSKGVVPLAETDAAFVEDLENAKQEFEPGLRRAIILMAMKMLADENNVENFSGAGQPKKEILSERLGFDVPAKELGALWQECQTRMASDEDFIEHPNAESVYKIINAEGREELLLIGADLGFEPEKLDGLQNRDLRKLLFSKYTI